MTDETMTTHPFELYRLERDLTRDQLIAELAATPERVHALVAGCSPDELQRRPAPDDWSPMEICRHIRDALEVYGMRFKWMILQDNPFLPNYEENRWVAESPDGPSDIDSIVGEMEAYRSETIRLLRSLSAEAWLRPGRHEVLGPLTLEPYVRHEVAHEEQHLVQLREALGTM